MESANKQVSQGFTTDLSKTLGGQSGVTGDVDKLASSIKTVGQDSQSATTGLGSLASKLASLGGGLGGGAGAGAGADASFGMFSEGGYSDSPVSTMSASAGLWSGAPHFAEGGTTIPGGGIPSILHPNEAVIPLSRGRSIPVEMKGGDQDSGRGGNVTHIHNNIHAKDADSFKLNATQIQNGLSVAIGRARARNG